MKQSDYDNRIAELYDEVVSSGYHDQGAYIRELLKIIPTGNSVIELGCGTGNITIPLNDEGIECEGVDESVHMLFRLKQKNPQARIHLDSAEHFRLAREFDYALSCSGPFSVKGNELESYILDPEEVKKCLRKYGRITKNGILINKGMDKEPLEISLDGDRIFRHRELRERDFMLMHHLLYEDGELVGEISNVKRRFPLDYIFHGFQITDFDNFMLAKC
jgi:SAM-dependent methyltransferase